MSHFGDMGVFHLPKNSGNSGWVVTFHRKISGKKWNSGNVSPVFPVETSNGNLCSILIQISRLYHEFHAFRGSKSVFWKIFANKLSGLLRLLCLPRSSARSRKFIAARMCPIEKWSIEILACSKMLLPVHIFRLKCCMNNSERFLCNFSFTGEVSTTVNLERWEDTDVSLLITTHVDNKHLLGGKGTKKDVFRENSMVVW